MPVRSYQELVVWQRAMDLVVLAYECTRRFPREEIYRLSSQVRRAAVSVPSNIAEGQGRGFGAEFRHHLRIGQGSLQEVETQILLAERLGYLGQEQVDKFLTLAGEVGRLNRRLHESVRA